MGIKGKEMVSYINELSEQLTELNLSYAKIRALDLASILRSYSASAGLTLLSLRGISCLSVGKLLSNACQLPDIEDDLIQQVLRGIKDLVEATDSLAHLDVSGMGLGSKLLPLLESVLKSRSLVSVHLGGNNSTQ